MELFASSAFVILLYVFGAFIAILSVVARALVFHKAGEAWWKAPIVIYGDYILVKLARAPVGWFWGYALSLSFGAVLLGAGSAFALGALLTDGLGAAGMAGTAATEGLAEAAGAGVVLLLVGLVLVAVAGVFLALISFKVAEAFGKSRLFALGLFALNPLYYAILAFGPASYQGKVSEGGERVTFIGASD